MPWSDCISLSCVGGPIAFCVGLRSAVVRMCITPVGCEVWYYFYLLLLSFLVAPLLLPLLFPTYLSVISFPLRQWDRASLFLPKRTFNLNINLFDKDQLVYNFSSNRRSQGVRYLNTVRGGVGNFTVECQAFPACMQTLT